MADGKRVVRQWLETDAAFGVTEVPLPLRAELTSAVAGRPAAAHSGASEGAPLRQGVTEARVPQRPAAAAPARPVPVTPMARSATPVSVARTPVAPVSPPVAGLMPGVEHTRRAAVPAKKVITLPAAPAGFVADLPPITRAQKEAAFAALQEEITAFAAPFLSDICTRPVFGEGDCDAGLMFIGEGPGAEEDRTGRPFVGRSGQLLDKMIAAIGYKREHVFIGNIVKLRAADWTEDGGGGRLQDRPPNPEEVARWIPFLHRQIEIIRPKVIVTLGAPAVKWVTGTTEGVMKIRGTWMAHRGVPLMPTYHPAFLLRAYTDDNRKKVWSDLQAVMAKLKG